MQEFMDTGMVTGSTKLYIEAIDSLFHKYHVSTEVTRPLMNFTRAIFQEELGNYYINPKSWIGLYIAAASLVCVFAMAADLLHGLRNQKLWFPCKYFITNAAFLSVISAAMKLPMDISTSMPKNVDQVTKLGSMAFLCTMLANLLPSLASMNKKELLTNITGLVITLVVNVCIQIQTTAISYKEYDRFYDDVLNNFYSSKPTDMHKQHITVAAIYLTLLLVLLILHICSSLAILKSKEIIDVKYHVKNQQLQEDVLKKLQSDRLTVEQLRQHVRKYSIMAGSTQFITVCFVTTSACGVICVLSTALHIRTLLWTIGFVMDRDYDSDYKWSMLVIFIMQFIGVLLGTITPLCRCFAVLCFDVSNESIIKDIKVFIVESYWTDKLYDWKRPRSIPLPLCSYKYPVIIEHLKNVTLKFCIAFQVAVVVTCKIISLVPLFMICTVYCLKRLKDKGKVGFSSKTNEESCVELGRNRNEDPEDIRQFVLHLQDDQKKISKTALKCISRSSLTKKGERQQPEDLFELIKTTTEGEKNNYRDHVTSLLLEEDSWSLLVVNLTTIAVSSLPDIDEKAEKLSRAVSEGLVYVAHVEQSLTTTDESIMRQKVAGALWQEFEVYKTWFDHKMQEIASQKNTREIVELFKEKGRQEDMVKEGFQDYKSICAKSMCRITEILLSDAIDHFNQQNPFEDIKQMISGILVDCLTNLPEAIAKKCHTIEIEKREATVQKAAELLDETTMIIETLQGRVPHQRLNPNQDLP